MQCGMKISASAYTRASFCTVAAMHAAISAVCQSIPLMLILGYPRIRVLTALIGRRLLEVAMYAECRRNFFILSWTLGLVMLTARLQSRLEHESEPFSSVKKKTSHLINRNLSYIKKPVLSPRGCRRWGLGYFILDPSRIIKVTCMLQSPGNIQMEIMNNPYHRMRNRKANLCILVFKYVTFHWN